MHSLKAPSYPGVQNRLLGDVEGERGLPHSSLSPLNTDSNIDSKIMLLKLKRARLEAQITLSKAQSMLAEMELHLVDIELRHELWRSKSEAEAHACTPAKSQARRPCRRVLVRKIRSTAHPHYRKPKSYTQDKRRHDVNFEEHQQLPDGSHSADPQNLQKQVGDRSEVTVSDDIDDGQKPEKGGRVDAHDAEPELSPHSTDDTNTTLAGRDEIPKDDINKTNIEAEIQYTDNIISPDEDKNQYINNTGQKLNDSEAKSIKEHKRRTRKRKTNTNKKDQQAEHKNNAKHESNTKAGSNKTNKSERKSKAVNSNISVDEHNINKEHSVKNHFENENNTTGSPTMVQIPIRVRIRDNNFLLEINNNDINRNNAEAITYDAVDATFSEIASTESTSRVKHSSGKEKNNKNAIAGTKTTCNDKQDHQEIVHSTSESMSREERKTVKKNNEKKKSEGNVEDKERLSKVSKEKHRSCDSTTKSSKKDSHESKKNSTLSKNPNSSKNRDDEKNNKNNKRDRNTDASNYGSRKSNKKTSSGLDENVSDKEKNAENKENSWNLDINQSKDDYYENVKSKSSITESFTEKSNNIETEKETQEIENNLLFKELLNCAIKKERSLSLSSMETLKLYEEPIEN